MQPVRYTTVRSPWGPYLLAATEEGLCGVDRYSDLRALKGELEARWDRPLRRDDPGLASIRREMEEYFRGERKVFTARVDFIEGTPFQRRVWRALRTIRYGEVRSYAWVAQEVGKPGGARAVGAANGRNPVAVVVPCHRVVNADGGLGGYSGGLEVKRKLLALEGAGGF
jgi:O-6-methylguanine DNA methyltransferase